METEIRKIIKDSISLREQILADQALLSEIVTAVEKLKKTVLADGTIFTCGNGGSACDAMHFTEELVARFKRDRPGIKSMHFMDAGTLTCWCNDYDFSTVFKRQVETFCGKKDLLVVFTTSGNSHNILEAVKQAKAQGVFTLALAGKDGGKVKDLADLTIIVPSDLTERIQEVHITLVHIFCEMLERD